MLPRATPRRDAGTPGRERERTSQRRRGVDEAEG